MLLHKNPRRKFLWCIVLVYRYSELSEYQSFIYTLTYQVNGTAAFGITCGKNRLMNSQTVHTRPPVAREQRGMYIEYPPFPFLSYLCIEDTQPSGKGYYINTMFFQQSIQLR